MELKCSLTLDLVGPLIVVNHHGGILIVFLGPMCFQLDGTFFLLLGLLAALQAPLLLDHEVPHLADGGLCRHLVGGGQAALVPACVLAAALLDFPAHDILHGGGTLQLPLKEEPVHLVLELHLDVHLQVGIKAVQLDTFRLILALNVVEHHDPEGEGVKHIQELVLGELVIGGQIQLSDKLVLKYPLALGLLVKAQGLS